MFTMFGTIAEFENDLRKERQTDGIAMAKSRGVHLERKSTVSQEQIQELRLKCQEGILMRELMTEYSISKAECVSVYEYQSWII